MSTAIRIENVSKLYRLGTVGTGTISHDLNRWWHTIRGKEDPYAKVGQVNDRTKAASDEKRETSEDTGDSSPLATRNSQLATSPDYVWALKDINLEVAQGEILGIIGRNGAGKSTLLKLLSRVTAPTTGAIKTKGRIASLLEVGTGFHPELTGRENIYLNGAILGMKRHEITKQLDAIVDFSGCAKYLDTPVKRYSSGMMVRLGFAVAAHLECEILIVDEVLAVGDAEFQAKCIGKMRELSGDGGRTVLFVSHNMASIRNLTRMTIHMGNGQISNVGPSTEVIDEYISLAPSATHSRAVFSDDEHKQMAIREVQVGEAPCSYFGWSDVIPVSVVYDVNQETVGAHVACLISQGEQCVFTTGDLDTLKGIPKRRAPGRYRGTFKIPGRFLNDGTFSVTVSIGIPFETTFDRRENAVSFSVEDKTSARQRRLHRKYPGVVRFDTTWNTHVSPDCKQSSNVKANR